MNMNAVTGKINLLEWFYLDQGHLHTLYDFVIQNLSPLASEILYVTIWLGI